MPFGLGSRPAIAPIPVSLPRAAAPNPGLLRPVPQTIAPPVSGEMVLTASNCPQNPRAWQNEPGPGAGESLDLAVVHRSIKKMEAVRRIAVPGLREPAMEAA